MGKAIEEEPLNAEPLLDTSLLGFKPIAVFIDIEEETGDPVPNVSVTSVSVLGSRAVMHKCLSLLSEPERKKLFGVSTRSSGPSRPRGWRWLAEFVDSDGNVFIKGVEQPDLKGTLPVTDVAAIKARQKANKEKRVAAEQKKLLKMAAEKKELKKAIDAQKDFLDHKAGK